MLTGTGPYVRHRLADEIPYSLLERRNPMDEIDLRLEYEVYGWFEFDSDADGVKGLDRKYVPVEVLAKLPEFAAKLEAHELAVKMMCEAAMPAPAPAPA